MAAEQAQDRELPASQKKLDDARKRGHTPRSRELTTAALLLAGAAGMSALGPQVTQKAMDFLRGGLSVSRAAAFDPALALEAAGQVALQGIMPALPLLGLLFVAALVAPLAIGGWVFSTEPITPDFSRLNPLSGLSKLVSMQSAAELGKAILKVILIGGVVGSLVWRDQIAFVVPLSQDSGTAMAWVGKVITRDFLWMAAVLLVIAAADVPLQLWQHRHGLRMSKEDVKREFKQSEGDPQVKGKRRQLQYQAARRRMMSAVPTADVVVTNPTHYAVALSYQAGSRGAPRVVAKGTDEVAARIRDIAAENGVPLLEAPPLARALYKHVELEAEIPAALYNAVSLVLAWVFQLRHAGAGRMPVAPVGLPVPPELDPLNEGVVA